MKNKKAILIIILVFVLLVGGAYVLYNRLGQRVEAQQMIVHAETQPSAAPDAEGTPPETEAEDAAAAGQPEEISAPDFTVMDGEGSEVQLSRYFGKPIVLNFWASWCGPCQSEMPDFNEKYKALGDDIHFVMVNMTDGGRETVETAKAFIEKNGYEFPVLFDTRSEAAMTYQAYSLPTTFFINAEGQVIAQATGAIDAATLQKGIDMISG